MKESTIEKNAWQYAETLGLFQAKFKSEHNRSVPDRLFINYMGLTFYIEFKATGKEATDNQKRKHRDMHAPVYTCDSFAKAKEVINAWHVLTPGAIEDEGIPEMHLTDLSSLD